MNIYKITIGHAAPKNWRTSMIAYILAENEEQVYEYIKGEPDINGSKLYNGWKDKEEENEEFEVCDKSYKVIGTENFKQKIIRIKGEINDDEYDFSSAYYGITLYGWELVAENVHGLQTEIELKIITPI